MAMVGSSVIPAVDSVTLGASGCIRIPDLLPNDVALALHEELRDGIAYERYVISDVVRQWCAARPLGEGHDGPMQRVDGWLTSDGVDQAIEMFNSRPFISWLSRVVGEDLVFKHPVTAYRLGRGDTVSLHDDMTDASQAVSVAYNLSPGWKAEWGGQTVFGEVTSVETLPTPDDSPFDLRKWSVRNAQRFVPLFNSLLIMRLSPAYAHGVEPITADKYRHALVCIYGRSR